MINSPAADNLPKSARSNSWAGTKAPIYIICGILAAALLGIGYLAFTIESATNHSHFGRAYFGVEHFTSLIGGHIFRIAIKNSIYLVPRLTLIVTLAAYPLLYLLKYNRWSRSAVVGLLVALFCIPIFTAWRPLFESYNLLYPHRPAIIAIGFVQLLRILPIVLLILMFRPKVCLGDVFLTAAAVTLLSHLADPTVPIELTGGAPMMSTHTWGSWSWQLAYVSRQYGRGAAAHLGMSPFLIAAAGVLWWLEARQRPNGRGTKFMLILLLISVPILRLLLLWVVDSL